MIVIPELPKGKIARPDDWREWYNFSQTEFVLTLLWSEVENCRILSKIESDDSCFGDPNCKGTRGFYSLQWVRVARQSFERIVGGEVKLEDIHIAFDRNCEIREWWFEHLGSAYMCAERIEKENITFSSYEELFWHRIRGNYPNNLAGWAEHRGLAPGEFEAQLQSSYRYRSPVADEPLSC